MWAFKTLWDKGLVYEGFRVLAVLLAVRDAAVATPRRGWTTSTATARTRRSRSASSCDDGLSGIAGLDDHAVDAAVEPGARGRARHRLRRGRARRACGYVLAEALLGAYARELGEATAGRRPVKGSDLVGRRYTPLFDFFADRALGRRTRSRCSAPTSCRPRTAPASCTSRPGFGEDDQVVCQRGRDPDRSARWTSTAGSPPRSPTGPGTHVFDANPLVIRDLEGARRSCVRHETYDHSYPHCWRCAQPADLPGGLVVVRRRSPRSATGWSSSTSRSPGCPAHIKDGSSASGWRTPATGRSAATGSGDRRSRCGSPTTRPTRASTSTARSPSSSATSACRSTDLHRPYVDDLVRPNPDDPTGRRRCGGSRRCSTAGSSPARCRSPRCTTRSRTPSGSSTTTRATSSSSTSARPAAGSTRCTCWPRRCSTGRRSANCVSHGIVLGDDGHKMSKSLHNYPDPREMFDRTAPTRCAGS